VIVKNVQSDPKRRLLSLHALKEVCTVIFSMAPCNELDLAQVVAHCSHSQLEGVAEMLWVPLFENSENCEETTRNVAAACLGKLATTHPSRYLPQLHVRAIIAALITLAYSYRRPEFVIKTLRPEPLLLPQFGIRLQRLLSHMMISWLPFYSISSR